MITKQKQAVLAAVGSMHNHPTADEIYGKLRKKHPNISLGTVYRNLNSLTDGGDIHRVAIPGQADRYDFRLDQHQHLQCVKCGKIFDIEAKVDIVIADSSVKIESYTLTMNGRCKICQDRDTN